MYNFTMMRVLNILCKDTTEQGKKYRHPSLSAVNWFQKNRALSETALTELHRKVSVQKLKSAT
jgi:hypothetical protein